MAGNKPLIYPGGGTTPPGQPGVPAPNVTNQSSGLTYAQIQALAASGGNAAMASPGQGFVLSPTSNIYLGKATGLPYGGGLGVGVLKDQFMTYQQAQSLPGVWADSNPDMLKQFINTGILNKVPGFHAGMGMDQVFDVWDNMLQSSWAINQKGSGKKWSPWDVLNSYANPKGTYGTVRQGDWLYDAATGQKIKYVGPRSKTTTSRDVNLSSAEDVKALTTQVLTQALGRAPTTAEVAQYRSTINAQESANPTVTTTTQTLNDQGEAVSQSSKTTGGFDAAAQQQLVQDQASQTPEYAKYQGGTTYWNALMQMMTGG